MLRRYHSRNHHRRRNPLKSSKFLKKLKRLRGLGLDTTISSQITQDFNSQWNDPSHSLYILDWWNARLSLIRFAETEDDRYLPAIARFAHRYKVDYHDLSLDDELQLDHYGSFRHFAQLAETNPYFRAPWPRQLHEVTYKNPSTLHYQRRERPTLTVVGEIREWDSNTQAGEPAIKLLTGKTRVVSETTLTRIAKDSITNIVETSAPSKILGFLHDMEDNMQTERYFEPARHDVLMQFDDGKAWVVIQDEDIGAEASSLGDCGQAENRKTILISLREPVTQTHWQALLKAEVAFPKLSETPSLEEIRGGAGVIVQLRGYKNSKPSQDLHPYIVPLLQQPWILHLVAPSYSSGTTFRLEDLDEEASRLLRKQRSVLYNPRLFYKRQKNNFGYAADVRNKLLDQITMAPSEILSILSAKRRNQVERRKAVTEVQRRLNSGVKHMRGPLIKAVEDLLLRTKSKALIKDILGVFNGHKRKQTLFLRFYEHRKEWLFDNPTFLLSLFTSMLKKKGYKRAIPPTLFRILLDLLQEYDEPYFDFVFRLIYATQIHVESSRYLRVLVERMLDLIIENDGPGKPQHFGRRLSGELCHWYQNAPLGWGSSEHREFKNEIPYSRKLARQLGQLIEISAYRNDDCYLDLAVTILGAMARNDQKQVTTVFKPLFEIIMDRGSGRYHLSTEAYLALGRIINA